jgi:glycosyltransferase involved in cell wall biosynthesis
MPGVSKVEEDDVGTVGGMQPPVPSRRPRIGIVVTELGIPSEVWIERQCREFTQVEPVLIAFRQHAGTAPPAGLELHRFGPPALGRRSLGRRLAGKLGFAVGALPTPAATAEIRRTLLAARLDGVFCHFAWNAIPVVAAVGDALPVVAQVHGRDVTTLLRWPAYRRALAATLPKLNRLVAVGSHQVAALRPLGLGPHEVIPCGAPLAQFAAGPLPLRADGTPCRFVSVGRISPEKGLIETLRAFEAVLAQGVDAEWVVVGDGPLMADLRAAVTAGPAAGRVRLAGMLPPAAVAEELAAAHVFVQHSRPVGGWVEGFGVTLTEAGASGLPAVSSDLGGIIDQLEHGANALLFRPGDTEAQAGHMRQLATDEAARRRMGERARAMAARFDSALMTARLETVLLAAVAPSLGSTQAQ